LLYNGPLPNGSLEKLSNHLIYRCRHFPALLPLIIFFVATVVAGLGAGYYTVLATMAPMILLLSKRTNLNIVIATLSVNYGALAGANFITSQSGVIFRELMRGAGVANDNSFTYVLGAFAATFVIPVILLGSYSVFNAKNSKITIQTIVSEPFDSKHKQSIMLIFIMMVTVLIVPILNLLMPKISAIEILIARIDIGF